MELPESIAATLRVVRLLDSLGVRYVIGGSLASSVHGVLRASVDADIVAELEPEHIEPFYRSLKNEFYIDENRIREAIRLGSSFNLIELGSMFKVDVFIAAGRAFETSELERGVSQLVWRDPPATARIASPEDTILAKLDWFRRGGEVSERQWTDVLGVIRVQGDTLDASYLRRMAVAMSLDDLLQRAFEQAEE